MATMQELVAGITKDARQQAGEIEEQTQKEIARINAETATLIIEQRKRLYDNAHHQQEEQLQRAESRRNLEAMQETLACKQQLIDRAFSEAKKELAHLAGVKRKKLLENLWKRTGIDVGTVITSKKDAQFFKGKSVKIKTMECTGGFIAVSRDGKVQVDLRIETLLESIRQHKVAQVSEMLFAKQKARGKR
jgi:vacuolar-type H+-ATPase subunit E/Vma4